MITVDLTGFKELQATLEALPLAVQEKVLQSAVNAGAREFAKAAKEAAPRAEERSKMSMRYGSLSSNIRVKKLKYNDYGEKQARVHTGRAFWGAFLEMGTRYIAPRHWLRQAFERTVQTALDKAAETMRRRVNNEAAKIAKARGSI